MKSQNCEKKINCKEISQNGKFVSHNSDFVFHNCEFISRTSDIKSNDYLFICYLVTETGFQLHRNINKNDKSTRTTIKVTENLTENIKIIAIIIRNNLVKL